MSVMAFIPAAFLAVSRAIYNWNPVASIFSSGILYYGIQQLLGTGEKPSVVGGQTIAHSESDAPFRHVVGKMRVWGVRVWPTPYPVTFKHRDADSQNHAYGQFQMLSATRVTSIDAVYSDDVLLELVEEERTGEPTSQFWAADNSPMGSGLSVGNSHLYVNYGIGDSDPGPRDTLLGWYSDEISGQNPFWPMDATPDAAAWLSSVSIEDADPVVVFPNGPPRLSALVTGIRVYDSRDAAQDPDDSDTWVWSDNSALIAAWFINQPFGFAVSYDDIDLDWLSIAANDCDVNVATFASTLDPGAVPPYLEKKYRCWGEVVEGDDRDGTLAAICATMAGGWAEVGGKWYIFAGAYHSPVVSVTDDWIFGEVHYIAQGEISQAITTLSGTFLSPTNRWQQLPYPKVTNADALAEVGGNAVEDSLDLVYVPSHTQAQRIAAIAIQKRRLGRSVTFQTYLGYALQARPGELVSLELPKSSVPEMKMRVDSWNLMVVATDAKGEGDTGGQLMVEMTLTEDSADVYEVDIDDLTDLPASPLYELPDWGGGSDNPLP